ncbi:divalent-cation tolerance protein CutA [Novosphingobium sediminicola]|uniref:Periplasmic divalent cation tolerance protein n=1 Tax=Novosphingobium sediminicola TaxID=563162 RepID=A0A7W6CLF8_9SPHN|nr:periplasmic divalent cation tolerance protein [Novosphingobium sediminicola]
MNVPVPVLVWCPFPEAGSAKAASRALVEAGLAACANILPAMESVYAWQGAVHEGAEVGVLFKTNADLRERCIERLSELHPYEEPAILGWECPLSLPATMAWLGALKG